MKAIAITDVRTGADINAASTPSATMIATAAQLTVIKIENTTSSFTGRTVSGA